jgi:hypothetical protein
MRFQPSRLSEGAFGGIAALTNPDEEMLGPTKAVIRGGSMTEVAPGVYVGGSAAELEQVDEDEDEDNTLLYVAAGVGALALVGGLIFLAAR